MWIEEGPGLALVTEVSLSPDESKTIELEGSGTGLITEILLSLVRSE